LIIDNGGGGIRIYETTPGRYQYARFRITNTTVIFGEAVYGRTIDLDITGDALVRGDLNVSGKIHNSISHVFGLATETFIVANAGVWYNITMNRSHADAVGFNLSLDNITIIIPCDGHYTITFGMGIKDDDVTPSAHVGMRVEVNGAELSGSYIEKDTHKRDSDIWMEHTTHATLSGGDEIILQYIASSDTVTIEQDDTYATQGFSAFGYIQEIME